MGLIGPLSPRLAPLVLHRRDTFAISLQEVDAAAYTGLRGVQGDRAGVEGPEALRNGLLHGIDPAVGQPAFGQGGAVGELALQELQIAQPRAEGIGGEHAGGDEIWSTTIILKFFFHHYFFLLSGWNLRIRMAIPCYAD